ncbi:hypothetical protein ACPV5O_05195 [Vibrio maritimus]|uniref:hypothetical protein n=1 Tax=Vibrio maritimus TaxID=990268 RepID=UPI004068D233
MHSDCKFVVGTKLKSSDLDFVLTPEECVGRLSRIRNKDEILNRLPKELASQISPAAKKSSTALISAIRKELLSVNWVGVSLLTRKTPLTDAQLATFPKLQAKIATLSDGQSGSVRQAGYKAVTDDVALVKQFHFQPTEPNPENKIVVEFAGQWSRNAACLMLDESDSQTSKMASVKADHENVHRSLATFDALSSEGRSLHICIPCHSQPNPIKLKLADDVLPVEKSLSKEEWDNVLIPILPVVKSGEEFTLKEFGYLYVIWDNKVWREVELQPNGYFADIDLNYYRRRDEKASLVTRHVNIDGSTLITRCYIGGETFHVVQEGKTVFKGKLALDETARVFGLTAEEVDIEFPDITHDPLTLTTQLSPKTAFDSEVRHAEGKPMPHIWVPYKIKSDVQSELYLHYSPEQLTLTQIEQLETSDKNGSISLSELSTYSQARSFEQAVSPIRSVPKSVVMDRKSSVILNQQDSNIAAVALSAVAVPRIRYLHEPSVDHSDDYFEILNEEHDWSSRAYFRSFPLDEEGYRTLCFDLPPPEVEHVDLVRGAHADPGKGLQHTITIDNTILLSELLG